MEIAEGMEWLRIFWIEGTAPKHWNHASAASNPPCNGWQHAFVMRGEKRSTLFCPYSLQSYNVTNNCSEIQNAVEPPEWRPEFMEELLNRKWSESQAEGHTRDYDTCALVMKRLGWKIPAQVMTGGGEDTRKKGGKETSSALKKPVNAKSKRGKFLQWFLDGANTRSIRETMAEFSMTRSNALSYLYMLTKDHGIGYDLVGDMATVTLPDGCTDPFAEVQSTPGKKTGTKKNAKKVEAVQEENDDWLD